MFARKQISEEVQIASVLRITFMMEGYFFVFLAITISFLLNFVSFIRVIAFIHCCSLKRLQMLLYLRILETRFCRISCITSASKLLRITSLVKEINLQSVLAITVCERIVL